MPKHMPHPSRGSRSALRHLPNALSLFRLIAGPAMVAASWETRPGIAFCAIFVLAGLSDGADGYLARKYDLCSVFGAELDGRADTCFYAAMVVVSLRWYATELRAQLPLILATVVSHLLQWAVAFVKFGRLAAYHSVTGKLWGSARRVEIELAGHRRDHDPFRTGVASSSRVSSYLPRTVIKRRAAPGSRAHRACSTTRTRSPYRACWTSGRPKCPTSCRLSGSGASGDRSDS